MIWRNSRSRPTNGASNPCDFKVPRTPDTTRRAFHKGVRPSLPFSSKAPPSSNTIVCSDARRVASLRPVGLLLPLAALGPVAWVGARLVLGTA